MPAGTALSVVTSLGSTSWAPCQVVCGAARMAPTQPEAPGQQRLDKAAAKAKTAWLSSWMLDGRLLTQAFRAPLGVRGRGWLARETREHDGVAVQPSARGDFFRSANAGRIGDTVRRAALSHSSPKRGGFPYSCAASQQLSKGRVPRAARVRWDGPLLAEGLHALGDCGLDHAGGAEPSYPERRRML